MLKLKDFGFNRKDMRKLDFAQGMAYNDRIGDYAKCSIIAKTQEKLNDSVCGYITNVFDCPSSIGFVVLPDKTLTYMRKDEEHFAIWFNEDVEGSIKGFRDTIKECDIHHILILQQDEERDDLYNFIDA